MPDILNINPIKVDQCCCPSSDNLAHILLLQSYGVTDFCGEPFIML